MKKAVLVLCVAVVAAGTMGTAAAAPLNKDRVSSLADWIVHIDHEQFFASRFGKLVREEIRNSEIEAKLQAFAQVFSFHPLDDVRNVTLGGRGKDPTQAVAMIQGRYNQQTLTALVSMNPFYEAYDYNGHAIHSWLDENKQKQGKEQRQYGAFYGEDTVLISLGRPALEHMLDVLDGKAASLGYLPDLEDFQAEHEGTFLLIAAEDVDQTAAGLDESGIAAQTYRFALAAGEEDATTYIDLTLEALNSEAATKIAQVLMGLKAFVSLSVAEKEPQLAQVVEAITIAWQDNVVRAHLAWDSQELFDMLKTLAKKHGKQVEAAISANVP